MKNQIMVDVETLGVGTFPALLSIGAVRFDLAGAWDTVEDIPYDFDPLKTPFNASANHFMANIRFDTCIGLGGHVDPDTVAFWFEQVVESPAAAMLALGPNVPRAGVNQALYEFATWVGRGDEATPSAGPEPKPDRHIWSHGATFDIAIMQRYFSRIRLPWPFHYRAGRDTRTLFEAAESVGLKMVNLFNPQPHNPLVDAICQANAVQQAAAWIKAAGEGAARYEGLCK